MADLRYRDMQKTTFDLKLLHQFFCSNGWLRDYELMEWQYFKHPVKQIYIKLAIDDVDGNEKIAASYGVVPLLFKVENSTAVAVLSIDTLTGTEYRKRGLFINLAKLLYKRCEEEGVSLVYGFPNQNSGPGFFKYLGWISLGLEPIIFKPLKISFFLRYITPKKRLMPMLSKFNIYHIKHPKLNGSQEIRSIKHFADEQFDELWELFSSQFVLAIHRNREYLNWRFNEEPGPNYNTLAFFEKRELKGFVTYCVKVKRGGQTGFIMELIYEPGLHFIGKVLLNYAINNIALQGAEAVFALNLPHSPNHTAFKKRGFFYVPKLFRPVECQFGVRKFRAAGEVAVNERKNWYISYCDNDTV